MKLFSNLFEIELKEHYENIFKFRDEEIELVNDIKMYTTKRAATPPNIKTSSHHMMSVNAISYKSIPVPSDKRKERKMLGRRCRSEYDVRMDQFK
mmetsp:Transcript_12545/g.12341  ORF Transcript_12545/g.12341 Transcript_12545/m.12341 type:complete len:95 (-) Transcript_12545:477-761(-)